MLNPDMIAERRNSMEQEQIIIMNDASPRTKLKKHLVSRGAEIPVYWSSKVDSFNLGSSMRVS